MSFLVTKRAEPHDFQRLGIVSMVRVYSAWLPTIGAAVRLNQLPVIKRNSNSPMSFRFLGILGEPIVKMFEHSAGAIFSKLAAAASSHFSNLLSVVFSIAAVTFAYCVLVGLAIRSALFFKFVDLPFVVLAVVLCASFFIFEGHAVNVSQSMTLKKMLFTGDYLGQ
jgi:hypothetical protein